jgi:hypothetical protein
MNANGLGSEDYISYVTGGGYFFLAALLWFFPMAIAHRILPRTRFENHMNLQAFEAALVGCSLIGLWLAVSVLPALVWFLFSRFVNLGDHSFFGSLNSKEKLEFVFYLAELGFAFFLIFGAHLFAQLVVGKKTTS